MRSKGKLFPHKYERIISEDLFKQVESVRNGYKVEPKRWAGLPYRYRGLIRCAECNCRITFEKKKQKYIYGHCTQYKGKHKATYVQEPVITSQFEKIFESIQIPEEAYAEVSEKLKLSHAGKEKEQREIASHLNSEVEKYRIRLERLYDDRLDNKISDDLYTRKYEEFNASLNSLLERQKNIELSQVKHYDSVFHLLKFLKDAPRLFKKALPEQKREMINMVLSNLELDKDLLRYKYKKPFEITALCNKTQNWLGR